MSAEKILLIILILMLFGLLPIWPYSGAFGYQPAVGLLVIIIVLIIFKGIWGKGKL